MDTGQHPAVAVANHLADAVRERIPFEANIRMPDGKTLTGKITGRACQYPHFVRDTHDSHIDVEVSWDLAYQILTGQAEFIRY